MRCFMAICKDCGFLYLDDDIEKCYMLKQTIESVEDSECKSFFSRRYDGNEPFTPKQHELLFNDESDKKKMKNIQGLRF